MLNRRIEDMSKSIRARQVMPLNFIPNKINVLYANIIFEKFVF